MGCYLTYCLFRDLLLNFHILIWKLNIFKFPKIFSSIISNFILPREYTVILILLTSLRLILWPNVWTVLSNVPCTLERHVCASLIGGGRPDASFVKTRFVRVFCFLVGLLPIFFSYY